MEDLCERRRMLLSASRARACVRKTRHTASSVAWRAWSASRARAAKKQSFLSAASRARGDHSESLRARALCHSVAGVVELPESSHDKACFLCRFSRARVEVCRKACPGRLAYCVAVWRGGAGFGAGLAKTILFPGASPRAWKTFAKVTALVSGGIQGRFWNDPRTIAKADGPHARWPTGASLLPRLG
jgi:hypothetical protein